MLRDAPVSVFQSDDVGDDGSTLACLENSSLDSSPGFELGLLSLTAGARVRSHCCECFLA